MNVNEVLRFRETLGVRQNSERAGFCYFFVAEVYSLLYSLPVNSESTPQSLLQQLAQIQRMERGKLCILRQGPDGPYYNHQIWENGKNVVRYVPRDQVPAFEEAIAGYAQFRNLTEQYAQTIIQKTRTELTSGLKKKTPRPKSSSLRTRKSSR